MTKRRKFNYFIPVAVIAGLGLAYYTSSKPWKVYQQEKGKATDMRTELNTIQKNDAKLKANDQLLNPVQKEEEARRLGYVRPDEVPLKPKLSEADPTKKESPKTETPKKPDPAAPPIDLRGSDKNEEVQTAPQ